jgi:hypothetical protein
MGIFKRRSAGEPRPAWWQLLIAIPIYLIREPAVASWKHIEGFDGYFCVIAAIPATLFWVILPFGGWLESMGFHWWSHTLLSVLAGAAFYAYLMPNLWRFVFHPVWNFCEAVVERTRKVLREHCMQVCYAVLKVGFVFPGSEYLWKPLTDEKLRWRESKIVAAVGVLAVCATLSGAAYATWLTYHFVGPAVMPYLQIVGLGHTVAKVIAVVAASAVAVVAAGIGWQLLEFGKMPYVGLASGAVAIYAGFGYISAFVGAGIYTWIACAAAYLFYITYLFPGVIALLSGDFWETVFKKIGDWTDAAYSERESTWRYFWHHTMTAILSAGIGYGAYAVIATTALSWYCVLPLVVVAFVSAYALIFKGTDHEAGNFMFALVPASLLSYAAFKTYLAFDLMFGQWGALTAAAITGVAFMTVIGTLFYVGLRDSLFYIGSLGLEGPLSTAFNAVNKKYLAFQKGLGELEDGTYRESADSAYRNQFLHLGNIAVAGVVCWIVSTVAAQYGIHGWLSLVAHAVASLASYLFVGRLILKSGWGTAFVSTVCGLLLATYAGGIVWSFGTSTEMKIGAGIAFLMTGLAFVFEYFPSFYAVVRFATESWTVSWLGPFLAWAYGKLWYPVDKFYHGVEAAVKWIGEKLEPVWKRLAAWYDAVSKFYSDFLKLIRGR